MPVNGREVARRTGSCGLLARGEYPKTNRDRLMLPDTWAAVG
jgi:hypothetical protein